MGGSYRSAILQSGPEAEGRQGMNWNKLNLLGKLVLLTILVFGVLAAFGQDGAPKLVPTEIQSLRLQLKQKDALLAKRTLEDAQTAFQKALTDLQSEGEKIKTDNNWPKDTQFDPNTLQFSPATKETKK